MSTLGKSRLSMKGNKNGLKEITKDDRFQARINGEDKIRLEAYCEKHGLSKTDFLMLAMVITGILPENRKPKSKSK